MTLYPNRETTAWQRQTARVVLRHAKAEADVFAPKRPWHYVFVQAAIPMAGRARYGQSPSPVDCYAFDVAEWLDHLETQQLNFRRAS